MEQGWDSERWAMVQFLCALNILFVLGIKLFLSQDAGLDVHESREIVLLNH